MNDSMNISLRYNIQLLAEIAIMVTLAGIIYSCRHPAEPPIQDTVAPGRRDYTWQAETLQTRTGDFIWLFYLWGASPNDVWCVGQADVSTSSVWHYNGRHWSKDSVRRAGDFQRIFGFSNTDIWAATAPSGEIWHYSVNGWSKTLKVSMPGYLQISFSGIWGRNSSDCFVIGGANKADNSGYSGVVAHYDGSGWSMLPIPDMRIEYTALYYDVYDDQYYAEGIRFETTGDSVKLFTYDRKTNNLHQFYANCDGSMMESIVGDRVYFSDMHRIYTYNQEEGLKLCHDLSPYGITFGTLHGRSVKDIVAAGYSASDPECIMHFNGTDAIDLHSIQGRIFDVFMLPEDIFVLTYVDPPNGQQTMPVIVRGTLKPLNKN